MRRVSSMMPNASASRCRPQVKAEYVVLNKDAVASQLSVSDADCPARSTTPIPERPRFNQG